MIINGVLHQYGLTAVLSLSVTGAIMISIREHIPAFFTGTAGDEWMLLKTIIAVYSIIHRHLLNAYSYILDSW